MDMVSVLKGEQLLGCVIDALRLHQLTGDLGEPLTKRRQRQLTQGRRVRHPCGLVFLHAFVVAGTPPKRCGEPRDLPQLFAPVLFARPQPSDESRLFAQAAHAHAYAWDRDVRPKIAENPSLTRAFLRFSALDLAVKAAHFRMREGLPPPEPGLPAWADRARLGEPIGGLLEARHETTAWTLELLASRAEVSVDSLKRWQRGQRTPKHENLQKLLVALLSAQETACAFAALSRHYAMAKLAESIRESWGQAFVHELAEVYVSAVACRMRNLAGMQGRMAEYRTLFDPLLMAFSSWLLPADVYLGIADHHAPTWRDDIELATELWSRPPGASFVERAVALNAWLAELHGEAGSAQESPSVAGR